MVRSRAILSESVIEPGLQVEIIRRSEEFLPGPDGVLFLQGDPPGNLYFLKSGEVTLTMHSKGREVLQVRAVAGSLLGLPAMVGNEPYTMKARADRNAQVFRLGWNEFQQLMKNQQFALAALRILAGEVRAARKCFAK
jgi:CRP-like cAMP-binding protein